MIKGSKVASTAALHPYGAYLRPRLLSVLTWLLFPQGVGHTGETSWGALL